MECTANGRLLQLPAHAKQEIRKMYNLDKPERMDEAIKILQDWIKKQEHILKKDFNREYLEKTILTTKGSVEKAKKQIDRLCTLKTLLPQYFLKTSANADLGHISELAWLVPLPVVTKELYRVFLVKFHDKTVMEHNYLEFYQYNMIVAEYIKRHDFINGYIVIYDQQNINLFDMMTKLNPVQLQQYVSILIEGYGGRVKGVYLLTQSNVVNVLVKMVKPFLSKKVSDRIFVYKTLEELHTVIDKDLLPIEYGGKQRTMSDMNDDWMKELSTEEHVQYVKMMRKACTNEELRRADRFNEEYMGMPGSFRNLTVD